MFKVEGNLIGVKPDSPFMKYLEISKVPPPNTGSQKLRVVGQIIALANHSDELVGPGVSWVELDPDLSKSLGLSFGGNLKGRVGTAVGVADLPYEYAGQLKPWETIEISRYGLLQTITTASVLSIKETKIKGIPVAGVPLQVIFEIANGQDWYPGTNCEVFFPMIQNRPFLLPATALLHEGTQEYLLQEAGTGVYTPLPVFILDTQADSVLVMGKMKAGDHIVSRGAILLKPLLHRLLRGQNQVLTDQAGARP